MTGISEYLSVVSPKINDLNFLIKGHRLVDWIRKENPTICCLQETHSSQRLKAKEEKKIFHAAILTCDKADFTSTDQK